MRCSACQWGARRAAPPFCHRTKASSLPTWLAQQDRSTARHEIGEKKKNLSFVRHSKYQPVQVYCVIFVEENPRHLLKSHNFFSHISVTNALDTRTCCYKHNNERKQRSRRTQTLDSATDSGGWCLFVFQRHSFCAYYPTEGHCFSSAASRSWAK